MVTLRNRARRADRRRAGASLVEMLVSAAILTVGLLNMAMGAMRCSELQEQTAVYVRAHNRARTVLEGLREGDLAQLHQQYTAAPTFEVDGQEVEVTFPADLLEDAFGGAIPATARYRDLDGDGALDLDPASNELASLLAVRVTVRQDGLTFQLTSLLTEK